MYSLKKNVLVLNQNYEPVMICNVKRAVILIYLGKAEVVEKLDIELRSITSTMPFPSVVRLIVYIHKPRNKIILSRKNILKRDHHTCQYCGKTHLPLTVDHIIPKQLGGKDSWTNLICACIRCNNKKGNRTPEQAEMKLLSKPKKPSHLFFIQFLIENPIQCWKPYLFLN
ncbi:MAG: HNH endonuclease [Calditrichia bacterium]|jgi:5-methylcytosine-specific restriction endonuclease McrA|nr:HNH endonuclease [Calditrichia bacterium]